jgi:hypothetical protein
MFTILKIAGLKTVLERELAPYALSLIIAQLFFKWGSFALELVGFVVTWFVLGWILDRILKTSKG